MTLEMVLDSLSRSCEAARRRGFFAAAEDYEDAMLLLVSRAHDEPAAAARIEPDWAAALTESAAH